jgi:hypothetical protein
MGLIKFLIVCFCVYLLLKWLLKPVIQSVLNKALQNMVRKHGQQFQGQYRQQTQQTKQKQEGSIHVDYVPPKNKDKRFPDDEGEYIDYEEVK